MKNLYRKVAVASVCTALGFVLGVSEEAKAVTFNLAPTTSFSVADFNEDNLGDEVFQNSILDVGLVGRNTENSWESRAFYEFNIANFSLASNRVISSAFLGVNFLQYNPWDRFSSITLFGYRGNGRPDASDFDTAETLLAIDAESDYSRSPEAEPNYNPNFRYFPVTPFVNQLVNQNDAFAGFTFHSNLLNHATYEDNAVLIIETADIANPVPEPTTIFGSALALGVGGWLKRKKSSQQNKTTSQN
jgi:hypothetical protein